MARAGVCAWVLGRRLGRRLEDQREVTSPSLSLSFVRLFVYVCAREWFCPCPDPARGAYHLAQVPWLHLALCKHGACSGGGDLWGCVAPGTLLSSPARPSKVNHPSAQPLLSRLSSPGPQGTLFEGLKVKPRCGEHPSVCRRQDRTTLCQCLPSSRAWLTVWMVLLCVFFFCGENSVQVMTSGDLG